MRAKFFYVMGLLMCSAIAEAADTMKVSIEQADSMFLATNYQVLASAMNIDAQTAQIIQAKLYPNPSLTLEGNAYDPQNKKAFHLDKSGEYSFQLDQLILLGGKRRVQIEIAKSNARIAELEFQDMVRQLKFELHRSLFAVNQQLQLLDKYNKQLVLLETIVEAYSVQEKKGNIPMKDVVRLKGAYLSLNNDRAQVYKVYFEELSKVQAILQTKQVVTLSIKDSDIAAFVKDVNLDELDTIAVHNRADYLIAQQLQTVAEQNVRLQQRLAIPDVDVYSSYDRRGGAFNDQINLGLRFSLPTWNRNQGNIKTARFQMQAAQLQFQSAQTQLFAEIQNYYSQYEQTIGEYQKANRMYNDNFELTLKGISDNFQKGNVSLIEFVDFFENYNSAMAEIARVKIQLATLAEQLNAAIGKDIF